MYAVESLVVLIVLRMGGNEEPISFCVPLRIIKVEALGMHNHSLCLEAINRLGPIDLYRGANIDKLLERIEFNYYFSNIDLNTACYQILFQ